MTVVQETFHNAARQGITGAVVFTPCTTRVDEQVGGVVGGCPLPAIQIGVDGTITTPDLAPGCYTVRIVFDCRRCPKPQTYTINLDDSPTPRSLFELINGSPSPSPDLTLPGDLPGDDTFPSAG